MKSRIVLGLLVLVACLPGCARDLARGCYKPYVFEPYPTDSSAEEVTREEAVRLASEYGLEEGVVAWEVALSGSTWRISSTTRIKPDGLTTGRVMHIDRFTGKLVSDLGWDDES